MNYSAIYESLINRARLRALDSYKESHHIVPKCMGGTDDKDNLVDLTPEEHYLAHQLLCKIYPNHLGLSFAALTMCQFTKYVKRNNKQYGWLRRKHAENVSATQTGKIYYNNGLRSIKLKPGDEIPEGFVKGRGYGSMTGKKGTKGSESFSDKSIQDELRKRRWDKDRKYICEQFSVDTIEQARDLVLEYKAELHPRYWMKPMLARYPFMTKTRLRSLISD